MERKCNLEDQKHEKQKKQKKEPKLPKQIQPIIKDPEYLPESVLLSNPPPKEFRPIKALIKKFPSYSQDHQFLTICYYLKLGKRQDNFMDRFLKTLFFLLSPFLLIVGGNGLYTSFEVGGKICLIFYGLLYLSSISFLDVSSSQSLNNLSLHKFSYSFHLSKKKKRQKNGGKCVFLRLDILNECRSKMRKIMIHGQRHSKIVTGLAQVVAEKEGAEGMRQGLIGLGYNAGIFHYYHATNNHAYYDEMRMKNSQNWPFCFIILCAIGCIKYTKSTIRNQSIIKKSMSSLIGPKRLLIWSYLIPTNLYLEILCALLFLLLNYEKIKLFFNRVSHTTKSTFKTCQLEIIKSTISN
ncbi:hypothetical protein VP01_1612g4 [Puccinia sorghi]|uniref:Uncharacterized protein n=1 Tax=Puccinia sorghi TaxID=27349 RepID=A0A0L6VH21_9BASI|nr:hypothetical protein VP01_1612g4 [Puccinia sorghi]